jgi:restriction endonuclease S subunit
MSALDIQKKIAEVLGVLDDKIELNNKINNNLEPANDNAASLKKEVA